MRVSSWWHEARRLYLRYLVAGAASVPVGIFYAYLATNALDRWWAVAAVLAVGVALAFFAWRASGRLFATAKAGPPALLLPAGDYNVAACGVWMRGASAVVALSIVVVPGQSAQHSAAQSNQWGCVAGIVSHNTLTASR